METLFWLIWRCRWVQRLGTFRWFWALSTPERNPKFGSKFLNGVWNCLTFVVQQQNKIFGRHLHLIRLRRSQIHNHITIQGPPGVRLRLEVLNTSSEVDRSPRGQNRWEVVRPVSVTVSIPRPYWPKNIRRSSTCCSNSRICAATLAMHRRHNCAKVNVSCDGVDMVSDGIRPCTVWLAEV